MENRQSRFNWKSNSLEFWDDRKLLLKRMIFLEILVIYKPSTFTVCLKELMWNCEFGLVQWTNTKQTLLKFPSFNHTTKSSIGTFNYLTWKKGLFLSVLPCVCELWKGDFGAYKSFPLKKYLKIAPSNLLTVCAIWKMDHRYFDGLS